MPELQSCQFYILTDNLTAAELVGKSRTTTSSGGHDRHYRVYICEGTFLKQKTNLLVLYRVRRA